jgi:hypothetical protein
MIRAARSVKTFRRRQLSLVERVDAEKSEVRYHIRRVRHDLTGPSWWSRIGGMWQISGPVGARSHEETHR